MFLNNRPLSIVLTASEALPFSKTGGLADVVGALAKSLGQLGHEVTLIIPDYFLIREKKKELAHITETGLQFSISMNGEPVSGTVNWTTLPGSDVRVLLIRQPEFFDRSHLYTEDGHDFRDNCARFCFFSRAVPEVCRQMVLRPDIIHCNDWQTALIPALLHSQYAHLPGFERTASVVTIHNMAYQGRFWHWDMALTGMNWHYFNYQHMEAWGDLNLLKTGIAFADQITTVSPTYAQEICETAGGCGLEGLLRYRSHDLIGILNGIDVDVWNSETDHYLPHTYSKETVEVAKPGCKRFLQQRMNLPQRADVPLFGMVSRMVDQKGFDLVTGSAERLLRADIQMVFLGTGDPQSEARVRNLAAQFPEKVAATIGFDESLAHQIEGGADAFLMPSRFEPCGLNQMYSLRYGTVPIVRKVGGLADSVVNLDFDPESGCNGNSSLESATGFVFAEYSQDAFAQTVERAVRTYFDKPVWNRIVKNGMSGDWSWKHSATKYLEVYRRAISRIAARAAENRR